MYGDARKKIILAVTRVLPCELPCVRISMRAAMRVAILHRRCFHARAQPFLEVVMMMMMMMMMIRNTQ